MTAPGKRGFVNCGLTANVNRPLLPYRFERTLNLKFDDPLTVISQTLSSSGNIDMAIFQEIPNSNLR